MAAKCYLLNSIVKSERIIGLSIAEIEMKTVAIPDEQKLAINSLKELKNM